ncbi:hypothetical protein T484DRAFT_1830696 [Baffinella frigidus]|nr:hypothetical protein T484DRAFT_1830696 [Cryptophyta sp. CCMP2293]
MGQVFHHLGQLVAGHKYFHNGVEFCSRSLRMIHPPPFTLHPSDDDPDLTMIRI